MTGNIQKRSAEGGARLVELDAMRGLAALSVALYHFIFRYPNPSVSPKTNIVYDFGGFPLHEFYLGQLPVYLFFIISGFVIFVTAEQCKTALEFCYRRFSRLYPVYWGAVTVMAMAIWIFGSFRSVSAAQYLVNLSMLQQYFRVPHVSAVFWSLTVEMSFYFLVAIAIGIGLMRYRKAVLLVWSTVIFLYGFYGIPNPIPWPIVYILVLEYGHFFVYGVAVYGLWQTKRAGAVTHDWVSWLLIALSFGSCILRYSVAICVIIFIIQVVFYIAVIRGLPFLRCRPLLYLGGVSYSFYLVHQVIGIMVMEYLAMPRGIEIALALAVVFVLAVVLTAALEQPAIVWLRNRRPAWAR